MNLKFTVVQQIGDNSPCNNFKIITKSVKILFENCHCHKKLSLSEYYKLSVVEQTAIIYQKLFLLRDDFEWSAVG